MKTSPTNPKAAEDEKDLDNETPMPHSPFPSVRDVRRPKHEQQKKEQN